MGKYLGYIVLGVIGLVGLFSIMGINHSTAVMEKANADVEAYKAKHPELNEKKTWDWASEETQSAGADSMQADDEQAEFGEGTDPTPVADETSADQGGDDFSDAAE